MPDFELVEGGGERVEEISLEELNALTGGPATGVPIVTSVEEIRKRIIKLRVPDQDMGEAEAKQTQVYVAPPEGNWRSIGKIPYSQKELSFRPHKQGLWKFAFRYWLVCVCGKKVIVVPGPFSPIAELVIKCFIIKPNLAPLLECFVDGEEGCCKDGSSSIIA